MLMAVGSLGSFKRLGRLRLAQDSCQLPEGSRHSSAKKRIRDFAGDFDRAPAHPISQREPEQPTTSRRAHERWRIHNELNGVHCVLSGILLRNDS
jgi:hypothetical protein